VVRTPYPVVLRLYVLAEDYWEILSAHFYQIDLMKLEPHRLLTLIYGWIKTLISPDDWEMFEMELTSPLPGKEGQPSETEMEQEGDLFMTALQTLEK
jgi:hypothetical protein